MRGISAAGLLLIASVLTGCGVNPVTQKREIQFVSEAQEIQLGEQHYAPTRQSEGGDLEVMPEITAYVNGVGQKLAAVSDRPLPYEFTVLNNSVPNAWALPGGKIAVNRGLLTELKNESELAAVLGHEIVHAAARHGAKAQERGTIMQAGLAVAQIGMAVGGVDAGMANLAIQGAGAGAQMIQMKYGREQELESDKYGMKYMKLAGYDVQGAVTLQETFVRLSGQGAKEQSWLEGLFASHPPSQERVDENRRTAQELGAGGEVGQERYAANIKPLLDAKPAYDKFDEAQAAAGQKDFKKAKALATEASKMLPQEGRFQEFLGHVALAEKHPKQALGNFEKAIALNPKYFGSYLGAGVANLQAGNAVEAETLLKRSAELLPTAPAAYYLGNIARDRGDGNAALQYYQAAATSNSNIGQEAAAEFVRLDLPQHPDKYVAAMAQANAQGQLIVIVENRAPVAISNLQVTPVMINAAGNIVREGAPVRLRGPLQPGERTSKSAGAGTVTPAELSAIRVRVDGASVAK
jgi:predicted Zn-dependent protease